uniref:helix-turn-helix domain-containing protein n=1 Tax=Faecousia sp. TaxID=2952921 RepID=UPI004027DE49
MSELSHWLGDVFKTERGKTGLSQQEVARIAGIDNRTILNIENYRGNPLFSNLYTLVRFYKIDPKILFYPEMQRESPAISRLRNLINDCTEDEAAAIFPVVESAINMVRNSVKRDI